MALFSYKARDTSGRTISETVEADTVKAAAIKLQASGLFPLDIAPFRDKAGWRKFLPSGAAKISPSEVTRFTSRLADLLRGGIPLARSLAILSRQTQNPGMKTIIARIGTEIQNGQKFSVSLRSYPALFPEVYVGMIQAGESAGLLEQVLTRLAEFSEKEEELRHRIKSALAYPAVMLSVGLLSIAFLLSFVIPKFETMFRDMGQMLPLPTRILIFFSAVLQKGWWVCVPLGVLGYVSLRRFAGSERGRMTLDRAKLKLPLIGDLVSKELVSRFTRMFSILLKNGVPVLDALIMARRSSGSSVLAAEIDAIYDSVREGKGIVECLRRSSFFPPFVADMVAVGEETGNLESSLLRVSETYDREVEFAVKTITSLLEPLIILIIGLLIGFVAVSMLLPVFQVSAGIR